MFALDDRTGNVVTTVSLFLVAATIIYFARGAFFILLLSLLFAYLLEPLVSLAQQHSRLSRKNRDLAIAQVYLLGTLALGGLGYEFGPHLVAQIGILNAAVPQIIQGLSSDQVGIDEGAKHGLSAVQQKRMHDWLARHNDLIARIFERSAASIASAVESAVWLFAVPILAIFILRDSRKMLDAFVVAGGPRRNQTVVKRILIRSDAMLARYTRAQCALAALSFVFYGISMMALKFPFALALGFLGGILEFIPVVGWIATAVTILTIGLLTHAHWIGMATLVIVWRLVQSYVNSPRIMGGTLQLKPLTIVFALMVGGQLGGIAGLYLSVPTVALLRIVWLECFSAHGASTCPPRHVSIDPFLMSANHKGQTSLHSGDELKERCE